MDDLFITVTAASRETGIASAAIMRHVPVLRTGRLRYVKRAELYAWLNTREPVVPPERRKPQRYQKVLLLSLEEKRAMRKARREARRREQEVTQ